MKMKQQSTSDLFHKMSKGIKHGIIMGRKGEAWLNAYYIELKITSHSTLMRKAFLGFGGETFLIWPRQSIERKLSKDVLCINAKQLQQTVK